jgi:hypothetical protein
MEYQTNVKKLLNSTTDNPTEQKILANIQRAFQQSHANQFFAQKFALLPGPPMSTTATSTPAMSQNSASR